MENFNYIIIKGNDFTDHNIQNKINWEFCYKITEKFKKEFEYNNLIISATCYWILIRNETKREFTKKQRSFMETEKWQYIRSFSENLIKK